MRTGMMQNSQPIVFVVDDDLETREALQRAIRVAGWRIETFARASEFLARAVPCGASCLVTEVAEGVELQRRVATDRPEMAVIFIAALTDVPTTVKVMKAGAVEVLMKPFDETVLIAAIHLAIARSHVDVFHRAEVRAIETAFATLSARERDVMRLVVAGLLNKQVGAELGISEITVKAHRGRVMRKMSASSLAHLVRMAAALANSARSSSAAAVDVIVPAATAASSRGRAAATAG